MKKIKKKKKKKIKKRKKIKIKNVIFFLYIINMCILIIFI